MVLFLRGGRAAAAGLVKSRGSITQAPGRNKRIQIADGDVTRERRSGRPDRGESSVPRSASLRSAPRGPIATRRPAGHCRAAAASCRAKPRGPGEMNVVERDTARAAGSTVAPPDAQAAAAAEPARNRRLRPLLSLMPYVARYRARAIAALVALLVAAVITLVVPVAVRRMIDFGFSQESASLIDSYFAVMIGIVAAVALSSAARFFLVTTLGERIVADVREDVFGHLVSLSSAYFDAAKTGELISRLTADTTQIKAAVGASVSVALRNLVLFVGAAAMMVVTSPRLSAFVLAAIPVIVLPLYGFGRAVRRRSRAAQDTLADATAYASELIGAVRVLQAFTN